MPWRRWLLLDERSSRQLLEEVVQEAFVLALPPSTSEWVMCHRPASLEGAINLTENHLALPPQSRGEGDQVTISAFLTRSGAVAVAF